MSDRLFARKARAAAARLAEMDPVLGGLIARVGPVTFRPEPERTPFFSLLSAIAHQQLSGKAAATILGRFLALFPGVPFPSPAQVLALDDAVIRQAGFSRPKTGYIKDIAAKTQAGLVPGPGEIDAMTDAEILARLTQIKGVGRWTVEMLLIFKLGRLDVLPIHDLGIQKGFALTYRKRRLPTPAQIEKYGERWRPHRTIAAWYLWRAVDQPAAV